LKEIDFSNLKVGRLDIDGDKIFALVNEYTTKENENGILEAHRKYIDLQYVFSGEESIVFEPLENQVVHKSYDDNDDYLLFKTTNSSSLVVSAGTFAIFYPQDLHLPGLAINGNFRLVKKLVIKILID
jgi:YhcH/YjgK/YiaL family protein